jgi:hypothetical protein
MASFTRYCASFAISDDPAAFGCTYYVNIRGKRRGEEREQKGVRREVRDKREEREIRERREVEER